MWAGHDLYVMSTSAAVDKIVVSIVQFSPRRRDDSQQESKSVYIPCWVRQGRQIGCGR